MRAGVEPHRVVGRHRDARAQLARGRCRRPGPGRPATTVAGERLAGQPVLGHHQRVVEGALHVVARPARAPAGAAGRPRRPRRPAGAAAAPPSAQVLHVAGERVAGPRPTGAATRRPGGRARSSSSRPPHQLPGRLQLVRSVRQQRARRRSGGAGRRRTANSGRWPAPARSVVEPRIGGRPGRRTAQRVLGRGRRRAAVSPAGGSIQAEQRREVGVLQPRSARSPSAAPSAVGRGQQQRRPRLLGPLGEEGQPPPEQRHRRRGPGRRRRRRRNRVERPSSRDESRRRRVRHEICGASTNRTARPAPVAATASVLAGEAVHVRHSTTRPARRRRRTAGPGCGAGARPAAAAQSRSVPTMAASGALASPGEAERDEDQRPVRRCACAGPW